ncbi:MAG: alpha-glucosidase [Clostridiales bacterium]|nr:alpha-glucosidase [Roseburia sp.]MDD7635794.1 alpha-glucosidase [Clostridiales bacterium]MDY4112125.1 alpha-glucosidase [Roseburia sp.]
MNSIRIGIGEGTASFPMKRGSFRYREQTIWRKELKPECISSEETKVCYALKDGEEGNVVGTLTAVREGARMVLRLKTDRKCNRYWITLPAQKEEHFYGCGETFAKFDLKGERVRIWVAEHQNSNRISKKIIAEKLRGKRPKRVQKLLKYESYYVQPTFVSSEKYYVHVDTTDYMEFDFTKAGEVTLFLHENAPITLGEAETFAGLSELLTEQLGRQKKLPDWIYDGVILGMQQGTQVVEQKLAHAKEYGIPVAGVWCQDWSGCRRTKFGYQVMWNWEWDRELYPNLTEKIAEWKREGIRFLGYINPFLAIEKELYRYASAHGYCVKNQAGEDYLVTITTFPAAMVDFTNPEAYEWYKGIIKENMIGIGMSGWMADFGEYLPPDCVLNSGEDAKRVHNTWPAVWARMNEEAIRECGVENEVFFFTRAGYTGSLTHSAMMWNGDQHVDFSMDDGLPSVIPATLSLAMSGYGITHSDAGGYTTIMHMTRTKELLMRWEEMNAFSPLLRTHEGNQPARNVQYDANEELMWHLSRMAALHTGLKPYLKECIEEAALRGTPVMRPLFYHYDECAAYKEAYEYLLGRDILVAPVLEEGATKRNCYLPGETWIHLFSGKEYGGGTVCIEAPIGQPPVFIRKDSKYREQLLNLAIK